MKMKLMSIAAALAAVSASAQQEDVLIEAKPGSEARRVEVRREPRIMTMDGGAAPVFGLSMGRSGDLPLIIASQAPDAKSIATLEEDLNIMARIIQKATGRGGDEGRKAMGIHLWTLDASGRGARNMYIEGHGAIFMTNVDFPLVAPAEKAAEPAKKPDTSSDWEETRNELFGGDGEEKGRVAQAYDEARVSKLADALIDSLKNATHIRSLKPDEFVTIVVQGAGDVIKIARAGGRGSGGTAFGKTAESIQFFEKGGPGRGMSVLTLRVRKADIDAFAKGKLDAKEFKKKLAIAAYQRAGADVEREERLF